MIAPKPRIAFAMQALVVLFLLFDSVIKLIEIQPVTDSFRELGFDPAVARGIGALELVCTILYALPRTAVLGAILLTGIFGGAIASHLRLDDPLFSHTLFGVYLGLLAWSALFLRDARLQVMIPIRRRSTT